MLVEVDPNLRFISRSPDRCWTVLAPRGPDLVGYDLSGTEHVLRVEREDDVTVLEALCRLEAPIYSHLNTFATLQVYGRGSISVTFSPCPDSPVEITPSDYPVGRPRRFAFVDAENRFRVVESRSGEKGPFSTLADGPLRADETLTMTFLEDGRPVCRVGFADWARQCSRDLSPTAGWGVPQNAIELDLDERLNVASVWLTLAGTSIGRGWDSVGHAAGTYRNRVTIEALP